MKKTIIAGVASVALAAMPVVGVFAAQATDPAAVVDTLTVNINGSCGFSRTNGQTSYTNTMAANALSESFGESTFTATCNNGTGYTVTADFTSLTHTDGAGTAITYDTSTPTAGSGTWTAYKSTATAGNIANHGTPLDTSAADPAAGTSFTVVYKVSTHTIQEQGTYQGTATYTLAQKATS